MKKFILLPLLLLISCFGGPDSDIEKFFEKSFQERLDMSPQYQTMLGIDKNEDKLSDYSEAGSEKTHELVLKQLEELKQFPFEKLSESNKQSYKVFEWSSKIEIENYKYRYYNFPINQMFGIQSELPSFMINTHPLKNKKNALNYIARLKEFPRVFKEIVEQLKKSKEMGIMAPRFAYEKGIDDIKNLLKDEPLSTDFNEKISKLDNISDEEKKSLNLQVKTTLESIVKPAYQTLLSHLESVKNQAPIEGGAYTLPKGNEYYQSQLNWHTSTAMNAQEIHDLGLSEVARIHNEMKDIMKQVDFKGDLKSFFKFMQTSEQFKYPDNKAGREQYISDATKTIDTMKANLDKMFGIKPKAPLRVKAVEAYREKSAGLAFYEIPAPDGSRPGTYYINLYDMNSVLKYEMEALAYHEGIPGHHMQLAIAQELKDLPEFRKYAEYTAYVEGWGLYSEYLPKEFGFYQDPYSDFGRLSMELWRACRLVVDTGIHALKWNRNKAIQYLNDNTPSFEADNIKAVERYLVMPGQATSYKIGMLKFQELKKLAEEKLGSKFKIQSFHDEALKYGALPLSILEENIHKWIAKNK